MERRELGKSGILLPPLMFGANVFGWTADPVMSFKLLDTLTDAGLNAIDTANSYSHWVPGHTGGESEAIIGVWLKWRRGRDKLIIATKVGVDLGPSRTGLSKARIEAAVDESLIRLQTDYIDLYQAHRDDEQTPLAETLEAFAGLIKAGKVRAIGASNFSCGRLRQALEMSAAQGLPRYESLQPHYNLMERKGYEGELAPFCLAHDVGVINYYGLASGFLTGKYRSEADLGKSKRGAGVKKYLNARGTRVLAALDDISLRLSATPAQVALAWLIAQPSITAPIASATALDQLADLVKATQLRLDETAISALNHASREQ